MTSLQCRYLRHSAWLNWLVLWTLFSSWVWQRLTYGCRKANRNTFISLETKSRKLKLPYRFGYVTNSGNSCSNVLLWELFDRRNMSTEHRSNTPFECLRHNICTMLLVYCHQNITALKCCLEQFWADRSLHLPRCQSYVLICFSIIAMIYDAQIYGTRCIIHVISIIQHC